MTTAKIPTCTEAVALAKAALEDDQRATPGPWLLSRTHGGVEATQVAGNGDIYGGLLWRPDFDEDDSDAERLDYLERDGGYIAAARTREPALARTVLRLLTLIAAGYDYRGDSRKELTAIAQECEALADDYQPSKGPAADAADEAEAKR